MFYNRKWIWNPFINWWLISFRISLSRALPPAQSSMFWLISNYLHLRRYYVLIFRIWYQKLESHANEEHRARINQWHTQWSLVKRIFFLPPQHIASASCEPWLRSQTSGYSRQIRKSVILTFKQYEFEIAVWLFTSNHCFSSFHGG